MKHQTNRFNTSDGVALFVQKWTPDENIKGTLIIAHGLSEHSGRYQHVAEYLVQHSYNVYALDHRGHGQSRGKTFGYFERFEDLCDDLRRFVEWVRSEEMTGPLFLMGHSMGALLSLYYTIRHQAMLKGVIVSGTPLTTSQELSAPTLWFGRLLNRFSPKSGVIRYPDTATISKDAAVIAAYEADQNVYLGKIRARVGTQLLEASAYVRAHLSQIALPILILHGGADRLISPSYSQFIYDHVGSPDKTLKVYSGLYHEILNEPEKNRVLSDLWVWLAAHQSTGGLRPSSPAIPD